MAFIENTRRYEYYIKDHLGNIRLTFTDKNNNGVVDVNNTANNEILQENHYYPFGMDQSGPWMNDAALDNAYKYNGKELHTDFGLGWYAYGARWYDAQVGRFTGVDPIIERFPWVNSYNYAENEPVANIDLHGLQKWKSNDGKLFHGPFANKSQALQAAVNAVQSNSYHLAYTGIKSSMVRSEYVEKVSRISEDDSKSRTKIKTEAREKSPAVTRTFAENMRPIAEESSRVSGTANKTNIKVNSAANSLGTIGKVSGAAGVSISVYNVATAEDKSEAIASEGGAFAGAIIGGEIGAEIGAVFGAPFAGVGAFPGAVVGGIIGSVVGGIIGSGVGKEIHDKIENKK